MDAALCTVSNNVKEKEISDDESDFEGFPEDEIHFPGRYQSTNLLLTKLNYNNCFNNTQVSQVELYQSMVHC